MNVPSMPWPRMLGGALTAGLLILTIFAGACGETEAPETAVPAPNPVMVFNVTSGAEEDPHAVTMALQLAGHALDDGRDVVLFFNVRAVRIPTKAFPEDLAFKDRPIKALLTDLIARGAEAQICPHCMHALGVAEEDLVEGATVTDREKLFGRLGENTVVFTY
jgi:predicted peroxiredoxin